ncbi:MAG: S-methyl-5-thioribose-1-phosphate isomerase [Candidatus Auribacterota bacterium]|jgi:methylthioribose-1-phosphate isomerase|nr:S-methyl-5-thioribose-1-phosphate isomerase [Candidatus Auribacterota bacterium]
MPVPTITWKNDTLIIIDQTQLPVRFVTKKLETVQDVWVAIKELQVRGAPAIGVAAALGVAVGIKNIAAADRGEFDRNCIKIIEYLATSRPTAVNLFWALDRMKKTLENNSGLSVDQIRTALTKEAENIFNEDKAICRQIGLHGNTLIPDQCTILTHCNAGGLATADYGTALGVIYAAHEAGKKVSVYSDETRPLLQGARLTTWELMQSGVDVTLICDNTAAKVMMENKIDMVIVGADRIAKNGDTANKIGTYMVAIAANAHNIPMYVAAPASTFDLSIESGADIPIEEREAKEVTHGFATQTAPDAVKVYSPAFDVTPARLISGFITEKGIIRPPYDKSITETLLQPASVYEQ